MIKWTPLLRSPSGFTIYTRNAPPGPRVSIVMLPTLGAFIGGTIGWYLGALAGTGTAFVLSMVGTAIGVYFAKNLKAKIDA